MDVRIIIGITYPEPGRERWGQFLPQPIGLSEWASGWKVISRGHGFFLFRFQQREQKDRLWAVSPFARLLQLSDTSAVAPGLQRLTVGQREAS